MNDATLTWQGNPGNAAPQYDATGYGITFTLNGTPLPMVTIPKTTAGEAGGYSLDFTAATSVTPNPGDVIGYSMVTLDSVDHLQSTPLTGPSVTEPTPPPPIVAPLPPLNAQLVLS